MLNDYLYIVVLVVIIGAFLIKFWELALAILSVLKYFAIPLLIAAIWYFGPALYHWFIS